MAGPGGRPKNPPKFKELLSKYIPTDDIFDKDEKKMYDGLVGVYMKDFDESQLTANDIDDILSIAMNRVLEIRLLKVSKNDANRQIDVSKSIDNLRKQTDKLKDNLAARRKDRIDPKKFSGFSIIDLALNFDEKQKNALVEKVFSLDKEEQEVLKSPLLVGNQDDEDALIFSNEDEE